jgi:hypothetical protein
MTIQVARLAKLQQGLTIPERLDAMLARYHADLPLKRSLVDSIPDRDVERWNRIAGLLNATHVQLGWYMEYVEATVTQLELRQGILLGLRYAAMAMDDHLMSILVEPGGDERRHAILTKQERLEEMSEQLVKRIAAELVGRWLDVRLAEEATESVALECWGRDLVHPEMRAKMADCRERLVALHESLKVWIEVELPEPDDAAVAHVLALLEREFSG